MSFFTALAFLTVLPSPARGGVQSGRMGSSFAYFPLVGLVIGIILLALNALLGLIFAPVVVNALLVVAMIALTGALHLDGLMDTCDGVLNAGSSERRLEIMKDSRVGGFGVVGAIGLLLLKFAALMALTDEWKIPALLLAPVLARWAMVYVATAFPYGRTQGGLGSLFKDSAGRAALYAASASCVLLALAAGRLSGIILLICVVVVAYGTAKFVMTRIPGLTGDVYGAVNELSETAVLLLFPVVAAQLPLILIGPV